MTEGHHKKEEQSTLQAVLETVSERRGVQGSEQGGGVFRGVDLFDGYLKWTKQKWTKQKWTKQKWTKMD
jgi:hypothetical protein